MITIRTRRLINVKKVLLFIIFGLFITMIGSCTYDNYIDDAIINVDF